MPRPKRIEGYAIVSVEGMIADAAGAMPDALKNDIDQRLFLTELGKAAGLVNGRHSDEGGPDVGKRRRIILTRKIPGIGPDPANPRVLLWNPAGASFEAAWTALGAPDGTAAILGGTDVFGLFLDIGYDAFHLSRAAHARIPGGRPVFPHVPSYTPEEILTDYGLEPGPVRVLDQAGGVTVVTWSR